MFLPKACQITSNINPHMVDGKIPDTPEAEDAVRSLFKLRRPGPRRWIDSILVWDDVMFNQHPSEKIERRRRNVEATKLECLDAEITAEVIDDFLPESPTALQIAKKRRPLEDLNDGPVPELEHYRNLITPSPAEVDERIKDILEDADTEPSARIKRGFGREPNQSLIERWHRWRALKRQRSLAKAHGENIH